MSIGNVYFQMQAKVHFARGGLNRHLSEIGNYGRKPLLVTGKTFVRQSGLLTRITTLLSSLGFDCISYPQVNPEPSIEDVEHGAALCREHDCDTILAVGGGSAMDAGKAIAVLARNPGRLKDHFGENAFTTSPLPVIAVPTTCGTGSEVTRYAVIVDHQEKTKKTIASESIVPVLSILDADLLDTLSPRLVVATAMDALSHGAESYLSMKADYLSQLFALDSIRILTQQLPEFIKKPEDKDIREKIFLASMLAGLAINRTGTIILHGMGYALTIKHNLHHGTANALLLPYVFQYLKNNDYGPEAARLEKYWGKTEKLSAWIRKMGLPSRLTDIGVREEELEELTELCVLGTQRAVRNMKKKLHKDDFKAILHQAMQG